MYDRAIIDAKTWRGFFKGRSHVEAFNSAINQSSKEETRRYKVSAAMVGLDVSYYSSLEGDPRAGSRLGQASPPSGQLSSRLFRDFNGTKDRNKAEV